MQQVKGKLNKETCKPEKKMYRNFLFLNNHRALTVLSTGEL